MNIEYLDGNTGDYPLIRIYGNEPDSIKSLMASIADLINGNIKHKIINEINGFNSINNCQLNIEVTVKKIGVTHIDGNNFKCSLPIEDWQTAYELLEPLSNKEYSYQWLDETNNISLLVSRYEDGQW